MARKINLRVTNETHLETYVFRYLWKTYNETYRIVQYKRNNKSLHFNAIVTKHNILSNYVVLEDT